MQYLTIKQLESSLQDCAAWDYIVDLVDHTFETQIIPDTNNEDKTVFDNWCTGDVIARCNKENIDVIFYWEAIGGRDCYEDAYNFQVSINAASIELNGFELVDEDGKALSIRDMRKELTALLIGKEWEQAVKALLPKPETEHAKPNQ